MKILIEAHHPAHIHFWKYPIRELQRQGHEVLMIGRDRDVMRRLLEVYDWIPSEIPKRRWRDNRFPLVEMFERQWAVARAIYCFQPDVVASLMGSYTQSAKLFGVRNVIFTDSEFQHFNHRIAHPFADEIHTPECFYKELGCKHVRYQGIHEQMFLRRSVFEPDESVLQRYGGLDLGNYVVIRLSAWNTLHDIGQSGIGEALRDFVQRHSRHYRILLSGEEGRIPELTGVKGVRIAPEDFHSLLSYAALVLTEGASTASEAASLGVPTVYINSTEPRGYLQWLEKHFGVVHGFVDAATGLEQADACLRESRVQQYCLREKLRFRIEKEMPDGVDYVVNVLTRSRNGRAVL